MSKSMNLFSVFDPSISLMSSNWLMLLSLLLLLPQNFWTLNSFAFTQIKLILNSLFSELSSLNKPLNSPGLSFYLLSIFFLIAFINLFSLLPYIYSATSHPVMAMTLMLPLWLGQYLFSWLKAPKMMLAHLVPGGTPPALIPMMVLIEIVSNLIRPLTLTVRLVANISAGHLIIVLIGALTSSSIHLIISTPTVLLLTMTLMVLELGVSVIQAYVFTMLLSLFLKEVNL